MTTERELDEILAEIGRQHRATGAPGRLESALLAAVDGRRSSIEKPRMRLRWVLAAAVLLLAAGVTAGVIWQAREVHRPQSQQAGAVPGLQFRPEPMPPSGRVTGRQSPRSNSALTRRGERVRGGLRDSSTKKATWNSLDEFVPLPVSEGLPTAAELSVVRMRLRGSDLQQYGLETPADAAGQTLLAEFVVGEDGLPRAIRIVR